MCLPKSMRMLAAALETAGLLLLASCTASLGQPITYTVTASRDDIQADYSVQVSDVLIDIRSQGGIGSVQFTQESGPAPRSVTMRLYLKGLEESRFQYADVTVTASVSSHDGSVQEGVSVQDGPEQPLQPDSPYWMDVQIVAEDPSIPLKDGYFGIQAPRDFLSSGSRNFTLSWVDFYR